ncbi:mpv17-like protein 2 [Topomyia yanbarensis]|uniref:mpv17-like protein 2 n=1 Tax=Topomyia yanbarensis TaxID=2498891 RepID=UPI00273A9BF7|nr:mpv17-like protein 2 [Topomyia yanbarensis]
MHKLIRFVILRLSPRRISRDYSSSVPPSREQHHPTMKRVCKLLFGRYLLLTNTVSSGLLMMLGDVVAQEIEQRFDDVQERQYDWRRIGCMTLVGISQGPMHHYLYQWMDRALPKVDIRTVFLKIGLDQLIMSPIFIISYLYTAGLLEGNSIRQCTDEFVAKYWTIYAADWIVWPPVQFINFFWLSPKYRVLYINAITMLYNVFLCYIKHNDNLLIRISSPKDASSR